MGGKHIKLIAKTEIKFFFLIKTILERGINHMMEERGVWKIAIEQVNCLRQASVIKMSESSKFAELASKTQ